MNDQQNDQPIFASAPLEQVREGMTVIDAQGGALGTVARLQMGDPQAATTAGNEPSTSEAAGAVMAPVAAGDRGPGVVASLWDSDAEGLGDVPDVLRRDLRRAGFIQVEGTGLEGANRFIPGDRVAEVSGNSVRLHPASTEAVMAADVPRATTTAVDAAPHAEVDEQPVERVVVTTVHEEATARRASVPRVLVSGGATVLVLGSAGLAAWLYRRWRREQARPINRLRRATARLRETLADNAAFGSGLGAGAVLLVLLALARRARRHTDQAERAESATTKRGAWASAQQLRRMLPTADDLAVWRQPVGSGPSRSGLGMAGSLLVLSGAGLLIWRRVRTGRSAAMTTPPRGAAAGRDRVQGGQARGEEVQAGRTPVGTGRVHEGNDSIEELTAPAVPVTREEVTIERHPVERRSADRPIGEGEHEELEVPVRSEQVTIEKLPEPAEDLHAANRQVPESRHISGPGPGEKARLEQGGDAKVNRPA